LLRVLPQNKRLIKGEKSMSTKIIDVSCYHCGVLNRVTIPTGKAYVMTEPGGHNLQYGQYYTRKKCGSCGSDFNVIYE
jgi:phage FluMu protein Com